MSRESIARVALWASVGALSSALSSCLTPLRAVYEVDMAPVAPAGEGYRIDPLDSALVHTREGLQIAVRYLTDEELRAAIPGPDNPYLAQAVDAELGYRPVEFAVFQVTVINPTFAKVRLDPERVALVTERGQRLGCYAINRVEARGSSRNFETYFLSRGVQTGNAQKLYVERMGKIRETIYHRDSPVFKGNTYSGKIVFDALPPDTRRVELVVRDFILNFGIHDVPTDLLTLRFPFSVKQEVKRPGTGDRQLTGRGQRTGPGDPRPGKGGEATVQNTHPTTGRR